MALSIWPLLKKILASANASVITGDGSSLSVIVLSHAIEKKTQKNKTQR
ncbi:hypothetical protein ADICYQ_2667 [Cyclobacterium qasimii M12-11B]|uniref:Uncharacterized protein n=1 Tax=Cyclobacterium qasimii M12-11B TaxID=641524 RepID=S7VF86_9BACT|nr:hypothetical protein ADICYQ_2667 [Cyclobacterium qasimii M12-11B]